MSTAEAEPENQPETTSASEAAPETTTEAAPEAPAPAPAEKPDVYKCSFQANGTHDKGTTDVKATNCDVDFDKTQILIIVSEGKQYHFNRTAIKNI